MNALISKKMYVSQLVAGRPVDDIFLVTRKTLAETKAGKPYLALGLGDKSGEIEARLWDNASEYAAGIAEGSFARIKAVAKPFRDQLQLSVQSLEPVADDQVNLADFMPASKRSQAEMVKELEGIIAQVTDAGLQSLLREIFQGDVLARFQQAPAAKKLHHAYIGGLLEHSLSMAGMVGKTAAHYPMLDRSMLLAGALLHDIAKIEEYRFHRPPFDYTDRGRLVGHLVLGVELVRRAAEQVEQLSLEQVDQLVHIILSHHGQLAFGSPVLPMTPEAIILHHLDDMDAKMNYMEGLRDKMAKSGWQWTDYQRHLERYLYLQGHVAPEEVCSDEPITPAAASEQSASSVAAALSSSAAEREQRQKTLFNL